jgi:hypothetical protein
VRDIETNLPNFIYTAEVFPKVDSTIPHLNYYFLNEKGREAVKRILCVYEYEHPQITFNPGILSVASILLHYMAEFEVFEALCYLTSTKNHFIESKSAWHTTNLVFTNLVKKYCVIIVIINLYYYYYH